MVSYIFLYVHPYLGKWSQLTNIFQMGWNHQLCFFFLMFPFDPYIYRERERERPGRFPSLGSEHRGLIWPFFLANQRSWWLGIIPLGSFLAISCQGTISSDSSGKIYLGADFNWDPLHCFWNSFRGGFCRSKIFLWIFYLPTLGGEWYLKKETCHVFFQVGWNNQLYMWLILVNHGLIFKLPDARTAEDFTWSHPQKIGFRTLFF